MARTAVESLENLDSDDDVVRDLEDSGYPVDGATREFIRQPEDLFATAGPVAPPAQLDSMEETGAIQSEDRGRAASDVPAHASAAEVGSPQRTPGAS